MIPGQRLAEAQYCYLTTTGRVTGKPHTIEIWFGLAEGRLYMLAGSRDKADWVRNLRRKPEVTVRIGEQTFAGRARIVEGPDEDALARRLLVDKYRPAYSGDLSNWGHTALPVAIEFETRDELGKP